MSRFLYTLMLRAALPLILLRLWWRGRREPAYRRDIDERLGVYSTDRADNLLWVHAVSVGEVRAAAPLVRALKEALPDHTVLVTCTTAAGRETLKQVYGESVLEAYLPYDFPAYVARFIEHFRPRLGILMETEVWPNLLAGCKERDVPVLLANARMSEKSAQGYLRWSGLSRPAFGTLRLVCAQSNADAARLRALGAPSVQVTGNLKFDAPPDPAQLAAGREWRRQLGRPVLLLASTREGEEALLLDKLARLGDGQTNDLLTVVVPRHPQRFDEVASLAQSRRSRGESPAPQDRVHLGDTMGEMSFYYGAADVAVIGGSFAPLGGQNLIEALAAGTPVVTGPSMYNFAEVTRLAVEAGAAIQCPDADAAIRQAMALLSRDALRSRMAQAGQALCEAHRGATARHLKACLELLKKGSGPFSVAARSVAGKGS